ncbi:hypothetical protein K490DRAFT_31991 [Saccharata proteae CBS 121410]|uniref:R3H-associated N-terminal domain-containing protein n=1 Tax=Saccharata proteae CBS 121410 TaxID=1314787 RepID=A0A9P4I1T5_9PEZI|nr:hypothetical protein K490DRAFT_31991 [Saccharata proteae CBS 121410]
MAIYPASVDPHAPPIDIEAWTEQAVQAISGITISVPPAIAPTASADTVRGTSVSLRIPLDDQVDLSLEGAGDTAAQAVRSGYVKRREPIRRDSLKRREALLRGKEGSRRRQRWENDRLLNNPFAQPPLPSDWEVRPTYPVKGVPYYVASLWENSTRVKSSEGNKSEGQHDEVGKVPRELREKLKRAKGARGLLRTLETEVRSFVQGWEDRDRIAQAEKQKEGLPDDEELSTDDEEIVFVGRNGQMSDMRDRERNVELRRDKLVFDTLVDEQGAAFGRWLVHEVAKYYGLRTWSVTVGDPARREAYVGIRGNSLSAGGEGALPQPLWILV